MSDEQKPFRYLDPEFMGPMPEGWKPAVDAPGQMPDNESPLANGDGWRMFLHRRAPGKTFVMLELEGKRVSAVPLGNLLHIGAALDPAGASAEQLYVKKLRQEVWDWQSKYTDQLANEGMLAKLRGELAAARAAPASSSSLVGERYKVLLMVVKAMLQACPSCGGVGRVSVAHHHAVDGLTVGPDAMPCGHCGSVRALIEIQEAGA